MHDTTIFEYDSVPLDIRTGVLRCVEDLRVHDVTYASPKGGRVPATLVIPAGDGPFAGILFGHGSAPTGRANILPYALDLARTGAVALLIDAPYVRQQKWPATFTSQDAAGQVQLIVDLRRAVDLLLTRAEVDPGRLAYIGHSHGAAMGGLLAGVERRIGSYVLACGDGGLLSHFSPDGGSAGELDRLPPQTVREWRAALEPIEPIRFVGHAAPAALFFQAALHDEAVPRTLSEQFFAAGSEPKHLTWYDAGHVLDEQALHDQVTWLARRIGIDPGRFEFRHGCRRISCFIPP
jgi:dienelactone hydrolase